VEDPAVARALAALDDQDRELLRLLAWEGLTQTEVASVMEISVEAARSRIRRARARFADLLEQMGAERTVGLAGDRP
jgi:RNA polymerase sigma-70 factor (ECF subfamily)